MSQADGGCGQDGGRCGCGAAAVARPGGLEQPGVLDALAHDTRTGRLILAMYEMRPWTLGEAQLAQLEQKLNAYLSFALDGELAEAFPHLARVPLEIQLRTRHEPSEEAWGLIAQAREQLALMDIALEVVQVAEGESL